MDDLLQEFLAETAESLAVLDVELVRFERESSDATILSNIFRLMHTIKGTCGFLGLPRLGAVAHAGVVSALDYDISMTDNRFENLSLLAPEKHSNAIADPTDTIPT